MITDGMLEKAVLAGLNARGPFYAEMPIASLDELPPALHWRVLTDYRAALEAVAADIRNAALEEARGVAKVAWLTCPHLDTVDADAVCAVSEHAANGIETLKSKVTP